MTYLSEVLADSPTCYYPLDVYSSGFTDSSGNARHIDTISGVAPSATAGSPGGGTVNSAEWGASAGFVRTSGSIAQPTVGTYEGWIYYPGSGPAAQLTLSTWSPSTGTAGACSQIQILTTGVMRLYIFNGSNQFIDDPNPLTTGWHHWVGAWGTGGAHLRVNKVTVDSDAAVTSASSSPTSQFRLHGRWTGAANAEQTGALRLAHVAFYPTKLSTARTDAHFDAMFSNAGTLDAVLPLVVPDFSGTYDGPILGTLDAELPLIEPSFSGSFLAPDVPGTLDAVLPSLVPEFTGTYEGPVLTDTSNALRGRSRGGLATVELEVPVVSPPAPRTARVDKAVPLPQPVLVKGRPT